MRRQTRLIPAEGGKFAGPVGTPVPPSAADLGIDLGDSAFQQRSHDYDLDAGECRYCHAKLSDDAWTVMREATGRANPPPRYRGVPIISDDSIPGSRTIYALPSPTESDRILEDGLHYIKSGETVFVGGTPMEIPRGGLWQVTTSKHGSSLLEWKQDEDIESIQCLNPCPDCGKSPCCYEGKCALPF